MHSRTSMAADLGLPGSHSVLLVGSAGEAVRLGAGKRPPPLSNTKLRNKDPFFDLPTTLVICSSALKSSESPRTAAFILYGTAPSLMRS